MPEAFAANGVTTKTQAQMQDEAAKLHNSGSDKSMESATNNAMKALMNLADKQIPTAVQNGYKAYGNYSNSEEMDQREAEAQANQASMRSLGAGGASKSTGSVTQGRSGAAATSFRRLSRKFLYSGEVAATAAELEKKSGMSREKFLDALVFASENKISPDDPQAIKKSVDRFKAFVATIPNPEFRGNIEGLIDSVPETVVSGVLSKAIMKFGGGKEDLRDFDPKEYLADKFRSQAMASRLAAKATSGASTTGATSQISASGTPSSAFVGDVSDVAAAIVGQPEQERFRDDGTALNKDRFLASIIDEAKKLNDDSLTLFARVSARYRKVESMFQKNEKMDSEGRTI